MENDFPKTTFPETNMALIFLLSSLSLSLSLFSYNDCGVMFAIYKKNVRDDIYSIGKEKGTCSCIEKTKKIVRDDIPLAKRRAHVLA